MPDALPASLAPLPVCQLEKPLNDELEQGRPIVLTAPTGSGKSTAVPLLLLRALTTGRILVLEPRRIAARSLARRVANLLSETPGATVGYQTRYETRISRDTQIVFMTEGILPRRLLDDPCLEGIAAVVFDEFHERSLQADLGLGLVRRLVETKRSDLRLLVMSATLDTDHVGEWLGARTLHADARIHPVDIRYAPPKSQQPPWEAAARAAAGLLRETASGDILVFMPGLYAIRRTVQALTPLRGATLEVMSLHGTMPPTEQDQVLTPPPEGIRRVIVATNVAETSLTLPGVRHVVDSGLVNLARYDAARSVDCLVQEAISIESADQRAGRAGRLGPGVCVRLWSLQHQYRKPARTDPEVQRADFAPVLLQLHALAPPPPEQFPWLDKPPAATAGRAAETLRDLHAITASNILTALGKKLADFPAHPRVGRFLLAAKEYRCGEAGALAAAVLTERPFLPRQRKQRRVLADQLIDDGGPTSDLTLAVAVLGALHSGHLAANACRDLGIHAVAAKEATNAAEQLAQQIGTRIKGAAVHENTAANLVRCMLLAFPSHLAVRKDRGSLRCELRNGRSGELARESLARESNVVVAGELRQTQRGGSGQNIRLEMVSEVPEAMLKEVFGEAMGETISSVWDEQRKEARTELRVACAGLILERETVPGGDADAEAALLADYVARNRESLRGWNDALQRWLSRVRWLAKLLPERGLLTFEEEDWKSIFAELCAGERRWEKVRNRDLMPYLVNALGWQNRNYVDTMAPERLRLPCGRRMRIEYVPGQPPKGKAKIQDLYGLQTTPSVAGERVPLLVEIQAPNGRAVQITDDLPRFWESLYPSVRQELSRRYPKHEWR